MKARFALLALGLALAGCANVKDIRDREPAFYGSPQRSAQEYAACVSAAWKGWACRSSSARSATAMS